jgi:tRNA (cytosine40_48-C5)-methyltransferase
LFHNEYSKKLAEKYGYKDWMISRFLNFVPGTENLLEYTENNKSPNYEYIRANNLKIESQKLKGRLIEKGYVVKDTILKEVFKVEKTKEEANNTEESRKNNSLPSIGST